MHIHRSYPNSPFHFHPQDANTCLLAIHGIGETPAMWREMGDFLQARAVATFGLLLPGHGEAAHDQALIEGSDWLNFVVECLKTLRLKYSQVFLCGLGLGGNLAWLAASLVPCDGIITVGTPFHTQTIERKLNPCQHSSQRTSLLPIVLDVHNHQARKKRKLQVHSSVPCSWSENWLHLIKQSQKVSFLDKEHRALVCHSPRDHVIPIEEQSDWIETMEKRCHVQAYTIQDKSFHLAPIDYGKRELFERIWSFVQLQE